MHTLRQIAERIGAKPETLRKRLIRAGMPAGLDTPLTDAQAALLFEAGQVRKSRKAKTLQGVSESSRDVNTNKAHAQPATERKFDLDTSRALDTSSAQANRDAKMSVDFVQRFLSTIADTLLVLIVVGHGLLIVQELSQMAGQIGRTAGAMVMLSILAAVALSSKSKWYDVSSEFVWFVFVLDMSATYLHYRAFVQSLGTGLAIGLACVVSFVAFFALYFYRNKNSTLFDGD